MPSKIMTKATPCLGVYLKSCKIYKNSCHLGRTPSNAADLDLTCQNIQNELANTSVASCELESNQRDGNEKELSSDTAFFPKPATQVDFHEVDEVAEVLSDTVKMDSKIVNHTTVDCDGLCEFERAHCDKGNDSDPFVLQFESSENHNWSIVTTDFRNKSSIDGKHGNNDSSEINIYFNNLPELHSLLQGGEGPLMTSDHEELEDTISLSYADFCDEVLANSNDSWLRSNPQSESRQEYDVESFVDSGSAATLNPDYFNELPSLLDLESTTWLLSFPEEITGKPVTLVLDLDETLVHTTTSPCDGTDFSFQLEDRILYVQKRPFLHTFLERVGELFQIIIFTAGTKIYADHVLDILDPGRRLTYWRAYRDSCIFSDDSYTKDLTVLGVDLGKLAIVDNTPAVFHKLQVNNGIPIKSWFGDQTDQELLSLLPFLEILAGANDVRPFISGKFGPIESS